MKRFAFSAGLSFLIVLAVAGNAPAVDTFAVAYNNGSTLRTLALAGNTPALNRLAAPTTTCAGADDPTAAIAVQENAMECLVNFARRQAGLPGLDNSRKLDGSADNKAGDILRCDQFSHEACGRDFLFWFRRAGYLRNQCWYAGENLAWGTGELGSAREIMKAWLHSPSHRANLLGSEYSQFGISLRIGGLEGNPDAHIWVNHFGRRC